MVRKRPKLGQIGRKVTRHNLISRQDTLNLVPTKPSLARIESAGKIEEQDDEDGERKRPLVSQMSLETLQREFELGCVLCSVYLMRRLTDVTAGTSWTTSRPGWQASSRTRSPRGLWPRSSKAGT